MQAADKSGGKAVSKKPSRKTKRSRAFREELARNKSARRFIGDSQIDLKFKRMATDPQGAVRPWYIAVITVGKMRHKFSLGGPAGWEDFSSPLDDGLVDALSVAAVNFALDEDDDDVPDHVTEIVEIAVKNAREGDSYKVRKTI